MRNSPTRRISVFIFLAAASYTLSTSASHHEHGGGLQSNLDPLVVRFPTDSWTEEITFRSVSGWIIVDVRVNGSEPLAFVLDTGTPDSVLLKPEKIRAVDLEFTGSAHIGGSDGKFARIASQVHFELGDLQMDGADLVVLPAITEGPLASLPFDGILGGQLFSSLVVEVDWENLSLRLHEPSHFQAPTDQAAVPLEQRNGYVYVEAEVAVDGTSKPVRLFVDTGATHSLSLLSSTLPAPSRRLTDIPVAHGLQGEIRGDIGRVDRLELGGSTFPGVVTFFTDRPGGIFVGPADGSLGAGILRRFVVTLDYSRDRMYLKPVAAISDPFRFSTSGLSLSRKISDDGSVAIRTVFADSPAARAGLTRDDRILSVNSEPVGELGIEALLETLQKDPGTRVLIEVRSDGVIREVELQLATLI